VVAELRTPRLTDAMQLVNALAQLDVGSCAGAIAVLILPSVATPVVFLGI
jgi:hypothetical protein